MSPEKLPARPRCRNLARSRPEQERPMSAKIIVSYDGTANEDDAIALGRIFARAGAELALAYVRHTHEPDRDRETLAQHEARELLERGSALFGEGAEALGAQLAPVVNDHTDLLVIDSRPEADQGSIALSSSAAHLIEIATASVLVVPRGVTLPFGRATAAVGA